MVSDSFHVRALLCTETHEAQVSSVNKVLCDNYSEKCFLHFFSESK